MDFVTPSTESKSAFGQLYLRPREIRDLRFTFRKSFTSTVRNGLAESLEINTFRKGSGQSNLKASMPHNIA